MSFNLSLLETPEGKPKSSSQILQSPEALAALETLFDTLGDKLQENHKTVLASFMGFGKPQLSQTAIANDLGLSRARVSAITAQAIKNLLNLTKESGLDNQTATESASSDLTVYKGEQIARALSWSNMSDEVLRREAMRAANARDPETLWSLSEAFLTLYSSKRSKVSAHTLRTYKRGVMDLLSHWQDENLIQPSRDAGPRYLLKLETTPYSVTSEGNPKYYKPETLNAKLSAARTLYKALRWAGATSSDPFGDVRPVHDPIPPEEKRQAYSSKEVSNLVAHAAPIDRAFVLLCGHGGLRADEVCNLKWSQVDFARGGMTVLGKGNKQQWVGFSDDLLAALKAIYEGQVLGVTVLPYGTDRARERLASLCQRAGVEYKGIHSLRHHAGTRMWELHRSLDAPADHLRHANVQTTRRYAKKTRDQRRELARGMKLEATSHPPVDELLEQLKNLDEDAKSRVLEAIQGAKDS